MKSLAELMNLSGRVALITGAAGHVGQIICETLAELGTSVALLDIDTEKCQKAATEVSIQYKTQTFPLCIDLENQEEIRSIPEILEKIFGRLDILVNNAALVGISELKGWGVPFAEQNAETWRRAMEVNLTSAFILSQSCTDMLSRSKHGSIINISSIYGMVGPDISLYADTKMGNPAAYAASKGGLLQLTRYLATVLSPHIRVNSITPGGIWRGQSETFVNRYIEKTPLKRMATEEDLKGAAAFLASDLSSYVTGHNLVVDGGWTAW